MFLKQLDIVGFKSFAERISVDFVPGVTAVVGPNGSGKSNITDAIRWVLGEQSAKSLRGAKMEDIIFAGSDSRKALNFAEVTLTLDNESRFLPIEYQEVSVTRRVFRSGESEFLINKQSCRLKDIVDLFMDSGLGREAFSIISQGKVEEILSSKAEERRTIFEEAAGVLKYKTRKKKAEVKLEETRTNLNRVQDILHELEAQVEPLQIQASIAKDYLEKKEELEQFEAALLVYEIEELHKKWQSLSTALEEHKQQELKAGTDINQREAALEQLRDKMAALDESVQGLQTVLLTVSEELEKVEGRKQVLKERMKNAAQNKEMLEKTLRTSSVKREELLATKKQKDSFLATLKKETNCLRADLRSKQEQLQLFSGDLDDKIDELKSDYIDFLNRQATAKHELQYIAQQMEQQQSKNDKLDGDHEKFIQARASVNNQLQEIEKQLSIIQRDLESQISEFRKTQVDNERLKKNYQKEESDLYQAYQFLQKAKSRKEMLEEMEEDYTGFYQGVREILKDKTLSGIEGAVAELIHVPKSYTVAIETSLGAALQHIIVKDEANARAAINYLKKNRLGRATFLPLSVIKPKSVPTHILQRVREHEAFVGIGADLVKFDIGYDSVIRSLLGHVLITTDLKGANEIARVVDYKFRIVTLEGDVVNPGGAMTGGAGKQTNVSLLSRKGEVEDLTTKLADMEQKTADKQNLVKTLKEEIAQSDKRLARLREAGEQLRLKEEGIKGQIRELKLEERNVNERLTIYDMEKGASQQETSEKEQRMLQLTNELQEIEQTIVKIDENIASLTNQKQNNQTNKDSLQDQINQMKIDLASRTEQVQYQQNEYDRLCADLSETESILVEVKEDLSLLSGEMNVSSSGEVDLDKAAQEKLVQKNETIQLIAERRALRQSIYQQVDDQEVELKEWKRQYKGLTETLRDEEIKLNRMDVEMDNRLETLREEYQLSFEAAKEQHPMTIKPEDAKRRVKLIKMAIEELGTVNIGAIEEYERVSERHDFLLVQKEDLESAKATLYEVIHEMDEEMKNRFEVSFAAIKKEFNLVFPSLFGGGRAELKLTDPEDILNTGVDIIAQPPGKKLQNLSLLSGGERALTAIALLFAILRVRPVPFCVLDEVEAALDEANVHRFSQYLKQYSKETQFIVITHRKGTMEEADVLYGVTMQESGVSRLVSVRLEESKQLVQS